MPADSNLHLERCPHCGVDTPSLETAHKDLFKFRNSDLRETWGWRLYHCRRCAKAVLAGRLLMVGETHVPEHPLLVLPTPASVDEAIPERAREYLRQALGSMSNPSGAVMLAASAVDSTLKVKGYKQGTLYTRIGEAEKAHLITAEMAAWAHDVRLEANSERHADETEPLPNEADARRVLEFAQALAQLLFVLPARVERGRKDAATGT